MTCMKSQSLIHRVQSASQAILAGTRSSIARYGYVSLIVGGAILIAGARTIVEKPAVDTAAVERLRKQVAVLATQKDATEAALADTQRRLDGCRRTIREYQAELASTDRIVESLQGVSGGR